MSLPYRALARPVLFRLGGGDPETAHEHTLKALARLGSVPAAVRAGARLFGTADPVECFGVRFPNRVGLAAGVDKDGAALRAWPALGFGHVEVGTVTRHPQPGNPRPRLYRLPDSAAIVNRMGFNNAGADALAARLDALGPLGFPLGISIGKSKVTPVEDAVADYVYSLRALAPYGDYFAVNVSSPNTPGLRGLQDAAALDRLLGALCAQAHGKPLLVKIAPDLTDDAIRELLGVLSGHPVAGVIATNTTLARDGLAPADRAVGGQQGGLSGRPLAARACAVVRLVTATSELPVIGVGGIATAADAARMVAAGASLVQLYTGFIYGGPPLVRAVGRTLRAQTG